MFRNILLSVFLFFMIGACCSSNEAAGEFGSMQPAYKKIAAEKYNKNYERVFNSDSTYLIVYFSSKSVTKEIPFPLRFFVYDNKKDKVIFEDNLTNGNVKWLNDHQVQVSTIPEIISGKEEENRKIFGYIYDVITKRKLTKLNKNK
jgi:hypothetical protein